MTMAVLLVHSAYTNSLLSASNYNCNSKSRIFGVKIVMPCGSPAKRHTPPPCAFPWGRGRDLPPKYTTKSTGGKFFFRYNGAVVERSGWGPHAWTPPPSPRGRHLQTIPPRGWGVLSHVQGVCVRDGVGGRVQMEMVRRWGCSLVCCGSAPPHPNTNSCPLSVCLSISLPLSLSLSLCLSRLLIPLTLGDWMVGQRSANCKQAGRGHQGDA